MSDNPASVSWLQSTRDPLRKLWQIPAFFLGVAAMVGVLLARPSLNQYRASGDAELAEARQLLKAVDGDPLEAVKLVQRFLDHPKHNPKRKGEALFLIGMAQVQLARSELGEKADEHWNEAHAHLENALRAGAPEDDRPRLMYLLGLAGHRAKKDPKQVVQFLSQSVEEAEDRVESYQALTAAYLRLKPPELEKALHTNEKLRSLPLLGEKILAPARLLGGELLMEMGRTKEARELFAGIGPDAPNDICARARTLQAESLQAEKQWAEAAALWSELLNSNRKIRQEDRGLALFHLGICYRRMEQKKNAIKVWNECAENGSLMAANASRLAIAEAGLDSLEPSVIRDHLQTVVSKLQTPEDWLNDHVALEQARAVFEQTIVHYLKQKVWSTALDLSQLYDKLAPPGGALFFQGEARRLWAASLSESETDPDSVQKSITLYRQAGESYEKATALIKDSSRAAQSLWLASLCYSQGQSPTQAISVVNQILKQDQLSPEQTCEAFYRLGDAYREIKEEKNAEVAYTRCLSYPGRYAYRARFELSQIEYRRGATGPAEEILRDNIKQLRQTEELVALESSLYALGQILFQREDYKSVRQYLKEAVERFPKSSWNQRGRYQLAVATFNLGRQRQKAQQPDQGDRKSRELLAKEGQKLVSEAAVIFRDLRKMLSQSHQASNPLTKEEQARIIFQEADALWWSGDYQSSLKTYEEIASTRAGSPDQLLALGYSLRCFIGLLDQDGFLKRVKMIRELSKKYDATTQDRYEKWIQVMERSFTLLKSAGGE